MDIVKDILIPVGIFAALGLFFGIVLAVASKIFEVKVDERVPLVAEQLPGANCGGCGYSGCGALAEAIVKGEATPTACTVGGGDVAKKIAEIMGIEAEESERLCARVVCAGCQDKTSNSFAYTGALDCVSAANVGGGFKSCKYGCLGLGTCVAACPFNAIEIENGIAKVDPAKCRACGICVAACPKSVIKMLPASSNITVACNSHDKGADTRKVCEVGCIACKICEKNCEFGAIKVVDNLAVIDYSLCTHCGKCTQKCPRKIITL